MALYKVLTKSFINDSLHDEGAVVELPEGVEPGDNLELVKGKAPAAKADAE